MSGRWTGFGKKTLWDWLQLLVVPLALAMIAFLLNTFEDERDRRRQSVEAARAAALAADRSREDALQGYLDRISDLLLLRKLGASRPGSAVQTVARSLTLTVLRQLDPVRKGLVVRFLDESRLLQLDPRRKIVVTATSRSFGAEVPAKVSLRDADLRGVVLDSATLYADDFSEADLRDARLRDAFLAGSSFTDADLRRADFRHADFAGGVVTTNGKSEGLIFGEADFDGACVSGARFTGANLQQAHFGVTGREVALDGTDLRRANLRSAALRDVDTRGAKLTHARLPRHWTDEGSGECATRVDFLCDIPPTGYLPSDLPP